MLKRAHELLIGDVVMTSASVLIVLQFKEEARHLLERFKQPAILKVLFVSEGNAQVTDRVFWDTRYYVLETVQVL